MRAPPWLAITALLCAGAFFAGRQSSGGGGAGPPQKQPARRRPPAASYTAEPLPSARTLPPVEAPPAVVATQAPASAELPPLVPRAARSGAAAAASAPEASAADEAAEPLTSGCAMPFWRRDQFDAARDWTGMADAPSLASADTWLRYDGTAAAGHLYSASTMGYVNYRPPDFVRGHGDAQPRRPAPQGRGTQLQLLPTEEAAAIEKEAAAAAAGEGGAAGRLPAAQRCKAAGGAVRIRFVARARVRVRVRVGVGVGVGIRVGVGVGVGVRVGVGVGVEPHLLALDELLAQLLDVPLREV